MMPDPIHHKIQRALVSARKLQKGGHLADARRACELVLSLDPGNGDARLRLGLVARQEGRSDEAIDLLSAALRQAPGNPAGAAALAALYREAGRLDEAEALLDGVLPQAGGDAALLVERGRCHMDRRDPQAALPYFEAALRSDPDLPIAYSMLGICYRRLGRRAEAFRAFGTALQLRPTDVAALNGIGNEYLEAEDFEKAVEFYRRALALRPHFTSAQKNLAFTLGLLNRIDEARAEFERMMQIAPAGREWRMDFGLFLLSVGDYRRGWAEYEYRWKTPKFDERDWGLGLPRWDGGADAAGPVLLWGEQGIGDQILYGTMLPDVIARYRNDVVIAVEPRLVPLFARSLPGERIRVVERGAQVDAVAQCPFGSIGAFMRTGAKDFGSGTYLRPDMELRNRLQARYRQLGKPGDRILGLSWRSANWALGDLKSLRLETLLPLLRQPGIVWLNLQYGNVDTEIAQIAQAHGVTIHRDPEIDPTKDLDGLAAQIAALDGVISTSNSTVHFAGALGIPCDVLLPAGRGRMWYWPREGTASPWYSAIRLRRQGRIGDWSEPVAALAAEIGRHG